MNNKHYGMMCSIDLVNCDHLNMSREGVKEFAYLLCKAIDMDAMFYTDWEKEGLTEEEWNENLHLQGVSACLFIKTSSITIHAIRGTNQIFVDCFSCKEFDSKTAVDFTVNYFNGQLLKYRSDVRG